MSVFCMCVDLWVDASAPVPLFDVGVTDLIVTGFDGAILCRFAYAKSQKGRPFWLGYRGVFVGAFLVARKRAVSAYNAHFLRFLYVRFFSDFRGVGDEFSPSFCAAFYGVIHHAETANPNGIFCTDFSLMGTAGTSSAPADNGANKRKRTPKRVSFLLAFFH